MLPEFIVRRGNRLQYRRAYPKELWPVLGNGSFMRSLRTSDPKEALRARPEAERLYFAKVDQARLELARRAHLKPLTKEDAKALAVRWFLSALDTAEDFMATELGDPEERQAELDNAEWVLAEERRALRLGRLSDRKRLAECLRSEAGLAEGDGVAEAAFLGGTRRADPLTRALAEQLVEFEHIRDGVTAKEKEIERIEMDVATGGYRPRDPEWKGRALTRKAELETEIKMDHARALALREDPLRVAEREAVEHFRTQQAAAVRNQRIKEAVSRKEAEAEQADIDALADRIVSGRRVDLGIKTNGDAQ